MSKQIDRSDIEKKLREIKGDVDDAATTAKPAGITLGAGAVASAIGVAFLVGQRKARKQTTVVEIRRA